MADNTERHDKNILIILDKNISKIYHENFCIFVSYINNLVSHHVFLCRCISTNILICTQKVTFIVA